MSPPTINRVLCLWTADGGTNTIQCDPIGPSEHCMPGCWHGTARWCAEGYGQGCPMHPYDLKRMMQVQQAVNAGGYNEVVIDGATYSRHLPASLEAFFLHKGEEAHIRAAHAHFLRAYGIAKGDADYVPLLKWHRASAMFVEVDNP